MRSALSYLRGNHGEAGLLDEGDPGAVSLTLSRVGLPGTSSFRRSCEPMRCAWSRIHDKENMVPSLGANVVTNLATQTLLGIGFLASAYLG